MSGCPSGRSRSVTRPRRTRQTFVRWAPAGNPYAGAALPTAIEWCPTGAATRREDAPSLRVAESAGFRAEGLLRSAAVLRGGGRTDHAVYGLIRADLGAVA